MTEEKQDFKQASLFLKISKFREEINNADWTPDKANVMQNYRYVSEAKFKGIISPALVHNGLECKIDYSDLEKHEAVGKMSQHYTVRATMQMIDRDTGAHTEYTAYGEAADTGDKGVVKAFTSAYKALFANNFMVSSYESESDKEPRIFSTAAEKEAAREVMSAHEFKPAPKAAEPVKAPAVPKAPEPVQTASEKVRANPPKAEVLAAWPKTAAKPAAGAQVSPILMNATSRLMNAIKAADAAVLIPYGGAEAIEIEYNEALAQGAESVKAWYAKYKSVA